MPSHAATSHAATSTVHAASFRDPSGFIFRRDDVLLRQVNQRCQEDYDLLMESGLYEQLVTNGQLIAHEEVDLALAEAEGAYNAVAPGAVPNKEFQRTLRRVLKEWVGLWAPGFAVKIGAWLLGSNGELALMGARLEPKRLIKVGFEFEYPELEGALRDLLVEPTARPAEVIEV